MAELPLPVPGERSVAKSRGGGVVTAVGNVKRLAQAQMGWSVRDGRDFR